MLECGHVEKLIKKRSDKVSETLYFAHNDDIYDIVKRAHVATDHGGRDRMLQHLSTMCANITAAVVELF